MKNWLLAVVTIIFLLGSLSVQARSKPWRAHNNTGHKVKVIWTAVGCAGTSSAFCGTGGMGTVCKTKVLKDGESADYKFQDGTSNRQKHAEMEKFENTCFSGSTTHRKKNGIKFGKVKGLDKLQWYDE